VTCVECTDRHMCVRAHCRISVEEVPFEEWNNIKGKMKELQLTK
jgi:hypothetical protein